LPKINVIQSTPSLQQVLNVGATFNTDVLPLTTNNNDLGSLTKRLKEIFSTKFSIYDGTYQAIIDNPSGALRIATLDNASINFMIDGITAGNTQFTISSAFSIIRKLIPYADMTYDLGDTNFKWRDFYLYRDLYISGNFKPEYTNYFLQEFYDHCNTSIAEIRTTDNSEKIINRLIHGCSVITNITSSKYRLTSGGAIGDACYEYLPILHNPNDYTYYSSSFKGLFESLTMQNELLFSVSDTNSDYFAKIEIGTNAGTIKCTTTANAGVSTTITDNITCDITTLHEYKINIKSGTIKFYVDGVEIASHTTNIFYNVAIGVYPIIYWETAENGTHYQEIDYMNIQLGRVF